MAETHDVGPGCLDPCYFTEGYDVVESGQRNAGTGAFFADGTQIPNGAHNATTIMNGAGRAIRLAIPGARFSECTPGPLEYITMWWNGPNQGVINVNQFGVDSFRNGGGGSRTWSFGNPLGLNVDWQVEPGSFNGGLSETLNFRQGADEHIRGSGATLVSGEDLSNNAGYSDNNNGANGAYIYVNRQTNVQIFHRSNNSLTSAMGFRWRRWPLKQTQRCVPNNFPRACVNNQTTPRFRLGWEQTNAAIDWFTDFVDNVGGAGWERSTDSGATWVAAPATATNTTAAANDEIRWRVSFTVPAGMGGWWRVRLLETNTGLPGAAFVDGAAVGVSNVPRSGSPGYTSYHWHTDYMPVEPGAHVFEYRERAVTAGSLTRPHFVSDYNAVVPLRKQFNVVECLNISTGAVVDTVYQETRAANTSFTFGLIP